ncbi:hypothetical protein AX15_006580 [Amanita polypyramis BW_CC]|nr:hypothetical protein AX15_006580 [Amanita polypyramis BW_CC]
MSQREPSSALVSASASTATSIPGVQESQGTQETQGSPSSEGIVPGHTSQTVPSPPSASIPPDELNQTGPSGGVTTHAATSTFAGGSSSSGVSTGTGAGASESTVVVPASATTVHATAPPSPTTTTNVPSGSGTSTAPIPTNALPITVIGQPSSSSPSFSSPSSAAAAAAASIPTPTSSLAQTFAQTLASVSASFPSSSSTQPPIAIATPATSAAAAAFALNYPPTLDTILVQITTTNSETRNGLVSLSNTLRGLPKESRDAILAGILPGGQDPLGALDVVTNTLGILWILSARLTIQDAAVPPPEYILEFCRHFDPEQARMAPDRVTLLAKGIVRYAAARLNNEAWEIEPLYHLVTRYPPGGSYLTTIHPLFVLACVATRHFTAALPVLQTPITRVDISLSDLVYVDNLKYHYIGGVALAALRRWDEAMDFFEICVASPAMVPSSIQLEALKKLKLVQLISKGKTSGLPKYTHQGLGRSLKNTPYQAFINAYPHNTEQLQQIIDENRQLFVMEKNLGLIINAFRRSPRWIVKKLTATYLTLSLADIARAVKIESEAEVRNLLLNMIEAKDISARISIDGSVTFFDPTPEFAKEDVDKLLQDIQYQAEHLRSLEREMGKDREYLKKALKQKDDPMWVSQLDDDLFSTGSGPGSSGPGWIDEPMYL